MGPPDHPHRVGCTGNGPWMPHPPPEGRPAEGRRLAPDAPHDGGRPPLTPWMRRLAARPASGRPVEGERLTPPSASERPAEPGKQHSAPAREANSQAPPDTPQPRPRHVQQNGPLQARDSNRRSAPHPLLSDTTTQQWQSPRPNTKRAPDLRRWTRRTRSSGRSDSEAATRNPPKRTGTRTPTWR